MPKPGQVYDAEMPVIGTLERKRRVVLVVSSQQFSDRTDFAHVLAISTHPPAKADTIKPRMQVGSLVPGSRIVTDVIITQHVRFLGPRRGSVEPGTLAAALAQFKGTLA